MQDAFAALVQKVEELRDEAFFAAQPLRTVIVFRTHFAALRSLRDELSNIRSVTEGLPRFGQPLPEAKTHWDLLPTIDWFWVKVGIKSGLVGVIAITLLLWIHPPGPGAIPLIAWIQTVLTRPFVRAGGTGDKGIFQNSFLGSLVLIGCIVVLLLVTPFLADYLVIHLVSYRKNLPRAAEPLLRPKLERLEIEFNQMLDAFSDGFRQGDCRREFPTLHGAVSAMDETVQEIARAES